MKKNIDKNLLLKIIENLKQNIIINKRIFNKIMNAKSINQANHFQNLLIDRQDVVLKLKQQLNIYGIKNLQDINNALNNIDKIDIKVLQKKIREIISFEKLKIRCYQALSINSVSQIILENIKLAKNKKELDIVLHPIPYSLLLKYKIAKSPKELYITTKKSVRAISVHMKNQ